HPGFLHQRVLGRPQRDQTLRDFAGRVPQLDSRNRGQGSMKTLVSKLRNGIDLSGGDINYAMSLLLSESTDDAMKAEFLIALHNKGESVEEIVAFVQQLIDRAIDPQIDPKSLPGPMVDVCGTSGDGLDLFNVSTTIMFVLAAGGVAVVKHGNRAVTSRSGSADVLEALGVQIALPPAKLKECVERNGLC